MEIMVVKWVVMGEKGRRRRRRKTGRKQSEPMLLFSCLSGA